jgi:hypothetical protein
MKLVQNKPTRKSGCGTHSIIISSELPTLFSSSFLPSGFFLKLGLLCSLGWPGTHDPPASASQILCLALISKVRGIIAARRHVCTTPQIEASSSMN